MEGSLDHCKASRVSVTPTSGGSSPFTVCFPGTQDLAELTNACAKASFGKGNKQVYDEAYRNALELDSTEFTTSFNLAEFHVLAEVARMMNVGNDGASLTAQLYKLNRDDDCLKPYGWDNWNEDRAYKTTHVEAVPQGCWKDHPVPDDCGVGGRPLTLTLCDFDLEGGYIHEYLEMEEEDFSSSRDIHWV
ncbi:hypothetical protein WJX73_009423 [Symbiochloris irregularis]|uniref:C-type lectin domain-containing protein n=1 Tax=Symbiochloris irregularis TaxID=706552 RepID=A0AAW1NXT9_9CHLO